MTLRELEIGNTAVVTSVGGEGALRQHFLDMGIIPGTRITTVKYAPMGDPVQVQIHGYELTLRLDDAAEIEIEKLPKGVKEGSLIRKIANIYFLDKEKEKTKEDSIKQKMDKLWKKRDNKGKN